MSGREGRERPRGILGFLCDAFFVLFPWGVLLFFAAPTLSLGWALADELNVVLLAKEFSPSQYFLDPHVYRLLSSSNLTPWTLLSQAADIWLWGFFQDALTLPRIVRVHEMASAALLVNVTYLVARLRLSRALAGVVVVVFTLSWPLVDAAVALPSRHYVEGALFAVLSLFFYAKVRGNRDAPLRGGLLLSAFFYLLSVTAKEVFVPLPVFLFLVDRRRFRERLLDLAGHIVVGLGYVAWRVMMLGHLVGGYELRPQGFAAENLATDALTLLGLLPDALFAGVFAGAVFLVVWTILLLHAMVRGQLSIRSFVALVLCVGVPVLPVAALAEAFGVHWTARYFLVVAWALTVLFGLSLASVRNSIMRMIAVATVGVAVGLSVPAALEAVERRQDLLHFRSKQCGEFLLNRGPETVIFLRADRFAASYVTLVPRYKEVFEDKAAPFVVEDPWLLPRGFQEREVFEMRPQPGPCFVRTPGLVGALVRERASMRVDPGWYPEVEWQADGLHFRSSDLAPTGTAVLVEGVARGLRVNVPPGADRVSALRKLLWSHGVKAPARLRLAWPAKQGGARVSQAVDVPDRFWDFSNP